MTTRPRPVTGTNRSQPARRTFSSGQRALLWAAGVLGALAIISAILIVLADRDKRQSTPVEQTVTDTVTPGQVEPPAPAAPSGWTIDSETGDPVVRIHPLNFTAAAAVIAPTTGPDRDDVTPQ